MKRVVGRVIRRAGTAVLTSGIVAVTLGGMLALSGLWAGARTSDVQGHVAFVALAFMVGLPIALLHALLVAPLADLTVRGPAAWVWLVHAAGGAVLSGILSPALAVVGGVGGLVFHALDRRFTRTSGL